MHRIWMGSDMPERYREYGDQWAKLNPEWQLWDWDEEAVMDAPWINRDVLHDLYNKSKQPGADMVAFYTHVADVVDYELVFQYGGWYFNTDLKPLRPLSELRYDRNVAAFANEDDVHAVNMAMYAPKNNYVFKMLIEELPKRYFSMPGAFMNASTGVQLIMSVLEKTIQPVQRFHRNVFNPIHWSEFDYGAEPNVDRDFPPETVAVHEWLHRTNQRGQRVLED